MKFVPCLSPEIRSRAVVVFYWFLFAFSLIGTRQLAVAQAGTLNKAGAPQAPNTAALGKFVELPVGYHTGIPNISIPLYTLTDGNLSLPVSLDYHASGLKPKEIPGWVGAGWSLSAGGMITRIVRGIPDDRIVSPMRDEEGYLLKRRLKSAMIKGFAQEFSASEVTGIVGNSPYFKSGYSAVTTPRDMEPDLYFYNFMGYSGRFTFSTEGKVIMLPNKDLVIEKLADKTFRITDDKGFQYHFTITEKTNNTVGESYQHGEDYVSGWYLTKIVVPHTQQVMEFRYRNIVNAQLYATDYYIGNPSLWSKSIRIRVTDGTQWIPAHAFGDIMDVCDPFIADIQDLRADRFGTALFLDTILIGKDTIRFFGNSNRTDLYKYKLDSVQVRYHNNTISRTHLNYSYFNGSNTDIWMRKLKLDSVKVDDKTYTFNYYENYLQYGVPGLNPVGEDLWGYYNGEAPEGFGKGTRYKAYQYNDQLGGHSSFRNPDFEFAKLGTLSSIQYPTGGKVSFEFEGNDFGEVSFLASPNDLLIDDATQLVFASSISASAAASTVYPDGPNSASGSSDFVLRNAQTVTLTGGIGLPQTGISLDTYNGIKGDFHSASYSVLKFDENTQTFVGISGDNVIPEELIGNVGTESAWEDVYRYKGWKVINTTLQLTPGKYRVRCNASGLQMNAYVNIAMEFPFKNPNGAFKAGGIRIKKISFDSKFSNQPSYVKKYDYSLNGSSSGVLESPFSNATPFAFEGVERVIPYEDIEIFITEKCYFINISQTPVIPLGNAQGGVIGYMQVRETADDNSSKVFHYTTGQMSGFEDVFRESTHNFAAYTRTGVKVDNSWKRGLLKQVDYLNSSNQLVKQEFSDYTFIRTGKDTSVSLFIDPVYDPFLHPSIQYEVDYAVYTTVQSLKNLDSVVTYSPSGNLLEVNRYEYAPDKYTFPIAISSETSDNRVKVTRLKYPKDYKVGNAPVNSVAGSIKNLLDRNMTSSLIEKYEQIQDRNGANVKTLSAEYIRYNLTRPMPDSVFRMRIATPITSYQPVVIDSVKEVRNVLLEPRLVFSRYDAFGNVIEQVGRDGIKESLIWGYGNKYLVAHLIGVGYDEAMMGVNTSVINQPATDALLRNEIQLIRNRLAAKKVMVTGYTYSPQIGITSISSPDSKVTYYEYDYYNRLKLIRDQDGKIISQHEYKFQATN